MKIVVIGGGGVFGSRLADLLLRDGHQVWVAARRLSALNVANARPLQLDRSGDLSPLWAIDPDVVVDAAGPFHAYGDDPYRLPRACIQNGCHYLDLADDSAFCSGVSALDSAASAAGVTVLSGVSSVPALSSAIVADLVAGADQVDSINIAILPGNKAPRGRAVVESILHQAGQHFTVQIDGHAAKVRSWSDPRRFALNDGQYRTGYAIRVPDQALFPAFFKARTVTFHAGMELGVMNTGLAALSWARARLGLPIPRTAVFWAARAMARFGSDAGGMSVAVTVRRQGVWHRHVWRLLVRRGEGPYIPGIAARTILRHLADMPAGARTALAEVSRDQITAALGDLAATVRCDTTRPMPLFERVLGADFAKLPPAVQASHQTVAPRRWTGQAQITRGPGLYPRLIAALFRFPKAAAQTPVTVIKTPHHGGERWLRMFGSQTFRSELRQGAGGMTERFGPFTFDLGLTADADRLDFPVTGGRFWAIPLPKWALPQSHAQETAQNGRFHFDVALHAPITGQMVVHYKGWLHRDDKGA